MANEQVTLTIDGRTATVPKGTKVVDAAKEVDVEIPVFCYHRKLGPLGCCRMCLVEVEKMPKLMTACTLDATQDMVVKTDTPKVEKAQKGVLEFTLLNHPLDCPVCDKGGECPLQNNTFKYGPGDTRMEFERFNNIKAAPLSPLITLDQERCIECQRCTRYSEVIEKDQALVMLNRGFYNDIGTFNNEPYNTRWSGNVIDLCPVGALTNTQFRFKARTWDLTNSSTLCSHCGCNCNMTLGVRLNRFMRIESRPNDFVDDGWICDKARWGYDFLHGKNRLEEPRTTLGGASRTPAIKEAVGQAVDAFKKIVDQHGPQSVGFLGSPYGTNEELYLYQKLFRLGLGTNNIDHKTYFDTPGLPVSHYDFQDIENSNVVLLIGSDPTEELPILDLRLKKVTTRGGGKLAVLNDQATTMDRYASLSVRYNVGSDGRALAALADGLARDLGLETSRTPEDFTSATGIDSDQMKSLVEMVRTGMKVCVIYNPAALTGASVRVLKHLLHVIGQIPTVECGAIPAAPYTNAVGALDMGVLPDFYPGGVPVSEAETIREAWGEAAPVQPGWTAREMIEKAASGELKALLVHRCNPVADFPGGAGVERALKQLDLLVVHDIMETETTRLAHLVLPSNGPGYDEGTTTNIGGRVQYRRRGLNTTHPPDWKIVNWMAKALGDKTDYITSFTVTDEISKKVPGYQDVNKKSIKSVGLNRTPAASANGGAPKIADETSGKPAPGGLKLRVATYLFAHDKILDDECHLAHHFQPSSVHLHEEDARRIGVKEGDEVVLRANGSEVRGEARISNRCNPGAVVVPRVSDEQGVAGLQTGTDSMNWVHVEKG